MPANFLPNSMDEDQLRAALMEISEPPPRPKKPFQPPTMDDRISKWTRDHEVNLQASCPFFARLPMEVRGKIWFYALTQSVKMPCAKYDGSDDGIHPFNYRPHHQEDAREALEGNERHLLKYDVSQPPAELVPTLKKEPTPKEQTRATVRGRYPAEQERRHRNSLRSYRRWAKAEHDWERPGYEGLMHTPGLVPLLTSCRLIYLEARAMVAKARTYVFWYFRGRPGKAMYGADWFFNTTIPVEARQYATDVHFLTQQYWLQDAMYNFLCKGGEDPPACQLPPIPRRKARQGSDPGYLNHVKTLRITIRRRDWWHNEQNNLLAINPFDNGANFIEMVRDMRSTLGDDVVRGWGSPYMDVWQKSSRTANLARRKEEVMTLPNGTPMNVKAWGAAFAFLPNLETVILDLEHSEDKRYELTCIAEWVRRCWCFPARSLTSPDKPPRKQAFFLASDDKARAMKVDPVWSWRGQPTQFGYNCTRSECPGRRRVSRMGSLFSCSEGWCDRKARMIELGLGPRMYGYSFVFERRPVDTQ